MALSEDTIRKRLSSLNTSQDSIQTASLWILHYKDTAIDKVAKCWMDVYKNADDKLRIALIYVMNDVVQTAGKKDRSDTVKMAFHPHVVNACGLANDTVKKAILRCVDVFAQRHVFPSHIVEEMRAALGFKKSRKSAEFDDNLSEVDYSAMIRSIESYGQNEEITEKARNILEHSNFNFKEKMQERMKDRNEGSKILKEMDESKNKLVQFLNSVERHQNKCKRLMGTLKNAKSSLNLQLRDVTIVDDAYEKFESGIQETRKQLNAKMDSGELATNLSPPRDAPSPLPTDDPFNVEGGSEDDMDIADDDGPSSTVVQNTRPVVKPVVPTTTTASSALDPRLQRLINKTQQQGTRQAVPREIITAMGMPNLSTTSPVNNDPRRRSRTLDESSTPFNGNNNSSISPQKSRPSTTLNSPITPKIARIAQTNTTTSQPYSPSMGPMNIDTTSPPPFFPQHRPPGMRVTGPSPASPNGPPPPMAYSPHNPPPYGFPPQNASGVLSYLPPPHMLPPPPMSGPMPTPSTFQQAPPTRFAPPPMTQMHPGHSGPHGDTNGMSTQIRPIKRKFP